MSRDFWMAKRLLSGVHPDYPVQDGQWVWRNEDIDRYNTAAIELMDANNVPVNNLHQRVSENREQYLSEDRLHLSESGQKKCAQDVADCISVYLSRS